MKKLMIMLTVIAVLSLAGCDLFGSPPPPPEETYTVTYDLNGGTGTLPTDTGEYEAGENVIAATSTGLTKVEFAFASWNTKADGTGTVVAAAGMLAMPAADTILYAQWADLIVGTWTQTAIQPGGMASATDVTTITATTFSLHRTIKWTAAGETVLAGLGAVEGATLTGTQLFTIAGGGAAGSSALAFYGFPSATTEALSGVVQSGTYVRTIGGSTFAITDPTKNKSAAITAAAATSALPEVIASPAIDPYTGYFTRSITFSTLGETAGTELAPVSPSNPKRQNWMTHFTNDGNTLTSWDGGSVMPVIRVIAIE